jgi:hypothetical protein
MRQLMTQHPPHLRVYPEPIIPVRPDPEPDLLAPVHVHAELVRVLVRGQFGKEADGVLVGLHDVHDGGVGGEALEEALGFGGVWQVREGRNGVEAVGKGGSRRGGGC